MICQPILVRPTMAAGFLSLHQPQTATRVTGREVHQNLQSLTWLKCLSTINGDTPHLLTPQAPMVTRIFAAFRSTFGKVGTLAQSDQEFRQQSRGQQLVGPLTLKKSSHLVEPSFQSISNMFQRAAAQ